ncbi:hypothetical protein J3459_016655 [Metarhizium acridum]|nr:hypothetical protein J3459_016655 [Metarhizium acridum]
MTCGWAVELPMAPSIEAICAGNHPAAGAPGTRTPRNARVRTSSRAKGLRARAWRGVAGHARQLVVWRIANVLLQRVGVAKNSSAAQEKLHLLRHLPPLPAKTLFQQLSR